MDVVKFLLEIGHLSHHAYSEELLDNNIGTSVIVGRVLSVSNTELNSGPLKCVSIREEPPLHLQDKPKNVINLFLRNEFAKLDIDVGVLVVVNPGTLTKARNQLLQAAVGFNGIGKMWIHGSATSAEEDPNTSGQQDVPGRGCCKGECFCGMASWCPTPFLNVKSRTMTLQEASSHSTSSFNLTCKVLKAIRLHEKDAVIRVTDGTLYKWPVLFFDGRSFATKSSMDREINFVDVYMSEIGNRLRTVKENVALKLYSVEIGKFDSGSGKYHCFRASGDSRRFKILQKTDTVNDEVDRPSNTETKPPTRVVRKMKEIACQTDSNLSKASETEREQRPKRVDRNPKPNAAATSSASSSSGAGIARKRGSRRLFHPSQLQLTEFGSKWPLSAPELRSTEKQQNTRSGEPADARKNLKRGSNYAGRDCVDSPNSSTSSNDRFLEDSLPPLTSVSQLTEITQQKQCSARPAVPPEAAEGGGGGTGSVATVNQQQHLSQISEQVEESSSDEQSLDLRISESPIEEAVVVPPPRPPAAVVAAPRCDRDSCEMVAVNTLDISQLPYWDSW